jgi:protocatechuate 3,4-dioxygenase beta subunit
VRTRAADPAPARCENGSAGAAEEIDPARRRALGLLVGTGSVLALGCGTSLLGGGDAGGGGGRDGGGDALTTGGGDAGADAAACTPTPEGEIGPYFADDSDTRFNRSNILSNIDGSNTQPGIPLTVTVFVVDGQKACAAYAGAQVDVWHCNASGVYSDQSSENTSTESWLRGYQLTDSGGKVSFSTIIPGWYSGRTTHIHLRVRSSYSQASSTSDGTNTTQLFFAQTFVDRLETGVAPYNAEGQNPTTNAGDRVYSQQENGANLLALSGDDTSGYTAAVTIVLPITSNGASANTGDGGFGGPPDGGMGGRPDGGFGGPPDGAMGGPPGGGA